MNLAQLDEIIHHRIVAVDEFCVRYGICFEEFQVFERDGARVPDFIQPRKNQCTPQK